MPTTDPRYTLRSYFDPASGDCKITDANMTKDDGVTKLRYEANYENGPVPIPVYFNQLGVDVMFNIRDLGEDPPYAGDSGPIYRVVRTGVQPVIMDEEASYSGGLSSSATVVMYKAIDEIRRIVDSYYRSDDKMGGRVMPSVERMSPTIVYGPTVEVLTKVYTYTAATGTEQIQRTTSVKIGYGASSGQYTEITDGIDDWDWGRIHDAQWGFTANPKTADSVSQSHSAYWWQLVLNGDKRDAFYVQPVTGAEGNPALVVNDDSNEIGYMTVTQAIRTAAGASGQRVFTLTDAYAIAPTTRTGPLGGKQYVYQGIASSISYVDS